MNTTSLPLANNHISVDCVVFGFDGERLNVLLINRHGEVNGEKFNDWKLPGSLIYQDEDLDQAASRVLQELTGLSTVKLMQYKAFGSKNRTDNPRDVIWLERAQQAHVQRIVTIAYIALLKIDRMADSLLEAHSAQWMPLNEVDELAFDHKQILHEATKEVARIADGNLARIFELLPRKFTIAQLRTLFEEVYCKKIDIRNFHKKITSVDYVVPLDERQTGVAHRAARYYRFDRTAYNKRRR